jgi:excisionase family DNA binding protein
MQKIIQIENLSVEQLLEVFSLLTEKVQRLHDELIAYKGYELKEDGHSDFITAKQAAKLLKINSVTLWAWTKKGVIIKYKVGKRVYYKHSELEAVMGNSNSSIVEPDFMPQMEEFLS